MPLVVLLDPFHYLRDVDQQLKVQGMNVDQHHMLSFQMIVLLLISRR
jgi:hypothetical protein